MARYKLFSSLVSFPSSTRIAIGFVSSEKADVYLMLVFDVDGLLGRPLFEPPFSRFTGIPSFRAVASY